MERITDSDGNVTYRHDDTPVRQVISEQTSATVRECLEYVVASGTGKNGQVAGYHIGGKTGTADKGQTGDVVVSFLCFAPADDPQVIMLITMDTPSRATGTYVSGGNMVAPTASTVMAEILPYLGVEPSYSAEELLGMDTTVPNVIGMSVEEAKTKLKDRALSYKIVGDGETITDQHVRYVIGLVRSGQAERISELTQYVICITSKGRPVKPKTIGQKEYVNAILKQTVTIGVGPAGTGKTYLAVAAAVAAFRDKQVNRIILTRRTAGLPARRPAVEGGPLSAPAVRRPVRYAGGGDIPEVSGARQHRGGAPGLYARADAGRQLYHSGRGPEHQPRADEDVSHPHGLRLQNGHHRRHHPDRPAGWQDVEGVAICRLTKEDVVRHVMVQRIIEAYAKFEEKKK